MTAWSPKNFGLNQIKSFPKFQHSALHLETMLICGIKQKTSILRGNSARSLSLLHTPSLRAPRQSLSRDLRRLVSTGAQTSPSLSSHSSHSFSSSRPVMTAQKIDGTAIAKAIREKINASIHQRQQSNPRYKPSLVIIQGICILALSLDKSNIAQWEIDLIPVRREYRLKVR